MLRGSVPRSLLALLLAVIGKVIVYLIRNCVNGKVYVGKTTKSLKRRWQQHVWTARFEETFQLAFTQRYPQIRSRGFHH